MMKFQQQPHSLMMVRPGSFGFNEETSGSNVFQHGRGSSAELALAEFNKTVDTLRAHDVGVMVFEDLPAPRKPDAIFPNNWISFHEDGVIVLYPMMAENRRLERQQSLIGQIQQTHRVTKVIDLTAYEQEGKFLEGTGSIVFDHVNRTAYACRSPRTNEEVLDRLCSQLGYRKIIFDAVDENGRAIYHTNVMMSVGEKFAVVCLDAIHQDEDQERILSSMAASEHRVIAISYAQMKAFCGNIIEVKNQAGEPFVLISERALSSLLPGQVHAINQFAEFITVDVLSIETVGGGGVRCMVAGVHLPLKS